MKKFSQASSHTCKLNKSHNIDSCQKKKHSIKNWIKSKWITLCPCESRQLTVTADSTQTTYSTLCGLCCILVKEIDSHNSHIETFNIKRRSYRPKRQRGSVSDSCYLMSSLFLPWRWSCPAVCRPRTAIIHSHRKLNSVPRESYNKLTAVFSVDHMKLMISEALERIQG